MTGNKDLVSRARKTTLKTKVKEDKPEIEKKEERRKREEREKEERSCIKSTVVSVLIFQYECMPSFC